MFNTYVREKKTKKNYCANPHLERAIEDVAKKYNVIKHKKNGTPILLYDFQAKKPNLRKTIRFIAQQASIFIREIPDSAMVGIGASKFASSKQIRSLLNENSGQTSVNSILILCTIFKLLQYDVNSKEYKAIIHEYAKQDSTYCQYNPNNYSSASDGNNCAKYFLGEKVKRILENGFGFSPGQQDLADYIMACSNALDNMVSSDAFIAVHDEVKDPNKKKEFIKITPNDFPDFPSN